MSCVQKAAASFRLDFNFIAHMSNCPILFPYLPKGNSDQGSKKSCLDKTKISLGKMTSKPALTMFSSLALNCCWFAMLVVNNKSISLLWELNSTFM